MSARDHDLDHDHDHTDADESMAPDATLGGYFSVHNRPPGFEGVDGQPYTVSVEAEKGSNLRAPWTGYLVFPRWAETGLGIVGHVATPVLCEGRTRDEVVDQIGRTTLLEVQGMLNDAIRRRAAEDE